MARKRKREKEKAANSFKEAQGASTRGHAIKTHFPDTAQTKTWLSIQDQEKRSRNDTRIRNWWWRSNRQWTANDTCWGSQSKIRVKSIKAVRFGSVDERVLSASWVDTTKGQRMAEYKILICRQRAGTKQDQRLLRGIASTGHSHATDGTGIGRRNTWQERSRQEARGNDNSLIDSKRHHFCNNATRVILLELWEELGDGPYKVGLLTPESGRHQSDAGKDVDLATDHCHTHLRTAVHGNGTTTQDRRDLEYTTRDLARGVQKLGEDHQVQLKRVSTYLPFCDTKGPSPNCQHEETPTLEANVQGKVWQDEFSCQMTSLSSGEAEFYTRVSAASEELHLWQKTLAWRCEAKFTWAPRQLQATENCCHHIT